MLNTSCEAMSALLELLIVCLASRFSVVTSRMLVGRPPCWLVTFYLSGLMTPNSSSNLFEPDALCFGSEGPDQESTPITESYSLLGGDRESTKLARQERKTWRQQPSGAVHVKSAS